MPELLNGHTVLRSLSTQGLQVDGLAPNVQEYIRKQSKVCQPDQVYVCDGSEEENLALLNQLQKDGRFQKLSKYENW